MSPPAQFARQSIRLQFDKDVHFGDDISVTLAKAGGDIIDTVTLRVDWPLDFPTNTNQVSVDGVTTYLSTLVQNSAGTAMIDRVELLYKDQMIERHYGESMFILGDLTIPEAKQGGLSNLVGTQTTSNLITYYIQFPFTVKMPLCALDEPPTIRLVFQPSTYFAYGISYTNPVNMALYVDYVYVSKAEREYLKSNRLSYVPRTFQRTEFKIPNTLTEYSCDTTFVNMVKELFWIIQEDQYTANVYNYSNDLVTMRLLLDDEEIITEDIGTPQFLTFTSNHTRKTERNYYSYSFELEPESEQENGSVNMSAVIRQRHILSLTPSNVWRALRIYAHSYNIFLVEKGNGRIVYPYIEGGTATYNSDEIIPYVFPPAPPAPLYEFNRIFGPSPTYLYYGQALAMNNDGTSLVVGAAGTNQNIGVVTVYSYDGTEWDTGSQLTSALGPNSYFGYSVDVTDDGMNVIAGTPAANGGRGYASVYTFDGTSWNGGIPLASSYADFTYGWSVAIDSMGMVAIVGAPRAFGLAGYACIFMKTGPTWASAVEIPLISTASSPVAFFGYSVSISMDGSVAVVGAPNARYVAVYNFDGMMWSAATVLSTSLPATVNFGWSVYMAPTGDAIIVGAPNNEYAAVYRYSGGSWGSAVRLVSDAGTGAQFGSAVALTNNGNIAIVGASIAGYAAAYTYSGGVWSAANVIQNQTGVTDSRFGSALNVSHDGAKVAVGAYAVNNGNGYVGLYNQT